MTKLSDLAKRAGNLPIIDQLREDQAVEQKIMELIIGYDALRDLILEMSIDNLTMQKATTSLSPQEEILNRVCDKQRATVERQRTLLRRIITESNTYLCEELRDEVKKELEATS